VVGASRGSIGAAIADGFTQAGGQVTITGNEEEPIDSYRGRYAYRRLDVSDEAAVQATGGSLEDVQALPHMVSYQSAGAAMR